MFNYRVQSSCWTESGLLLLSIILGMRNVSKKFVRKSEYNFMFNNF